MNAILLKFNVSYLFHDDGVVLISSLVYSTAYVVKHFPHKKEKEKLFKER